MENKLRLYLAGPLSGWRGKVFSELNEFFEVYDPIQHSRQRSQSEYAPDDLNAVKDCNVILAFQPKDKSPCLAMAVEATMGFCNGALIIYVDETGSPDPILIGISKRPFSDLNQAVEFLKRIAKDSHVQGI